MRHLIGRAYRDPAGDGRATLVMAIAGAAHAGTLDTVKARGKLVCGVNPSLLGFSVPGRDRQMGRLRHRLLSRGRDRDLRRPEKVE